MHVGDLFACQKNAPGFKQNKCLHTLIHAFIHARKHSLTVTLRWLTGIEAFYPLDTLTHLHLHFGFWVILRHSLHWPTTDILKTYFQHKKINTFLASLEPHSDPYTFICGANRGSEWMVLQSPGLKIITEITGYLFLFVMVLLSVTAGTVWDQPVHTTTSAHLPKTSVGVTVQVPWWGK